MRNNCPLCNSNKIYNFLTRDNVPVHQNYLISQKNDAIHTPSGKLTLSVCQECGFIFNQTFEFSKLQYGPNYNNVQDYSTSFSNYTSNLVSNLISNKNVRNSTIVEVGCGKGYFLRKLVENESWGNIGYGFDPSYDGLESDLKGRLNFKKQFYDQNCANINPNVVICRHVIEHVEEPVTLLRTIKNALKHSPDTKIFFETPTVNWILHNKVIWDFFYEHCSYFTAESISTAFEIAGFQIDKIEHVFAGQYLWVEASIAKKTQVVTKNPKNIKSLTVNFSKSEQDILNKWTRSIEKLNSKGKVSLWGAGAKGVTFANLVDHHGILIDSIIDINPYKYGKHIPGTGHQIINFNQILQRGIKTVILMNPNYYDENLNLLNDAGISVDLLTELN